MKFQYLIVFLITFKIFLAKSIRKDVLLTKEKRFQYITKFTVSIGKGLLNANFHIKPNINFNKDFHYEFLMGIYMDYEWQNALEETTSVRKSLSRRLDKIVLDNKFKTEFNLNYSISQTGSPHVWYFALMSIDDDSILDLSEDGFPLEGEFTLLSVNGSHFSHEESGLLLFSVLFTIILGYCLVYSIQRLIRDYSKIEEIDYPTCLLISSILFQFLSLFSNSIHLFFYSINGKGIGIFHLLSTIFEVGSEFLMTTLITMFSMGWCVTKRKMIEPKKIVSLIASGLLIHLMLATLSNPNDDIYNKFHEYDGIQGFFLVFLRISMFCFSLYSLNETKKFSNKREFQFISWFSYIGSLYQLAFPLMILLGMIFVPYLRFRIVKFGNLIVQIISLMLMTNLLTGKTEYYNLSNKCLSFLPGMKRTS